MCARRTRQYTRGQSGHLVLLLLATLGACADDPMSPRRIRIMEPNTTLHGRAPFEFVEAQALEYAWTQGHVPTPMGSTTGRVCLLTFVQGDFQWASEYVRIYASNGTWYLYGGSLQTGVKARARCINTASYSGEYAVTAPRGTDASVSMQGIGCGLTRVGGMFKNHVDWADIVQSVSDPRRWVLSVRASTAANGYVHARARCVERNAFLVGQGSWQPSHPSTALTTDTSAVCYLSGVTGDLNGSTYWLRVRTSGGIWFLDGGPDKNFGWARGNCLKPYFFGTS